VQCGHFETGQIEAFAEHVDTHNDPVQATLDVSQECALARCATVNQRGVEVGEERHIDVVEKGFSALDAVNARHQDVRVPGSQIFPKPRDGGLGDLAVGDAIVGLEHFNEPNRSEVALLLCCAQRKLVDDLSFEGLFRLLGTAWQ
jgi:hypothetical protein